MIVGEVRNVSLRRTRGRLTVLKAMVADESGSIPAVWFNQDWLAGEAAARNRRAAPRPAAAERVRGSSSYDLNGGGATADLAPIYPAGEEITPPRMRALADRALELARDYLDFAAGGLKAREALPTRADALYALHRPRTRRGGGERPAEARVRRAAPAPARPRPPDARAGAGDRAGARRAGRAARALPRGAAVRADRAPGAGDRGHRPRPRARRADAAAAPGRRRLGEDGGRALRAPARGRARATRAR